MRSSFLNMVVLLIFLGSSVSFAPLSQANGLDLPKPGSRIELSRSYNLPLLKGLQLDRTNPFRFDFFVDGGAANVTDAQARSASATLIKYFLASLTIPSKDLWVNLSPYEQGRIVPDQFGRTEMGRDMLAQDYLLKQITASMIYPESAIGKKFWDEVYHKASERYGQLNVPVNTFNKVWILPDKAVVYEHEGTAYVVENHLKVMLEEDYLAVSKNRRQPGDMFKTEQPRTCPQAGCQTTEALNVKATQGTNGSRTESHLSTQIVRDIVVPVLEKEVNEGANFAQLRQVFSALILATWYKKKIKDSILNKVYSNRAKIGGIDVSEKDKEKIYQEYLVAFKKGVFNYVKEEQDAATGQMLPRKYFSGGVVGTAMDAAMVVVHSLPEGNSLASGTMRKVEVDFGMTGTADAAQLNDNNPKPQSAIEELFHSLRVLRDIYYAELTHFRAIYKDKEIFPMANNWDTEVLNPTGEMFDTLQANYVSVLRSRAAGNYEPVTELLVRVMAYKEKAKRHWEAWEGKEGLPIDLQDSLRVMNVFTDRSLRHMAWMLDKPFGKAPRPYSIKDLMDKAVQYVAFMMREQNIELTVDLGDTSADIVNIDENDFYLMMLNIFMNALEAINVDPSTGKHKFVRVKVEKSPAGAAGAAGSGSGPGYRIEVEDSGIGIAADVLPGVLQPFVTTKGEDKDGSHKGLGLSLTKELAEANGGHISIASEQGRGTKVTLFLPPGKWNPDPIDEREEMIRRIEARADAPALDDLEVRQRLRGWEGLEHNVRGKLHPVTLGIDLILRNAHKSKKAATSEPDKEAADRQIAAASELKEQWSEVLNAFTENKDFAYGRIQLESFSGFGVSAEIIRIALIQAGILKEFKEKEEDAPKYVVNDLDGWEGKYLAAVQRNTRQHQQSADLIEMQRTLNTENGLDADERTAYDTKHIGRLLEQAYMGDKERGQPEQRLGLFRAVTARFITKLQAFIDNIYGEDSGADPALKALMETPYLRTGSTLAPLIMTLLDYVEKILKDDGGFDFKVAPTDIAGLLRAMIEKLDTDQELADAYKSKAVPRLEGFRDPTVVYVRTDIARVTAAYAVPPENYAARVMRYLAELTVQWRFFNVSEDARTLSRLMRAPAEKREEGYFIVLNVEENLPAAVVDSGYFSDIYENFISNSAKALRLKWPALTQTERLRWIGSPAKNALPVITVTIRYDVQHNRIVTQFHDNGPGFPKHLIAFKYGESTSGDGGDHGHGLYTVEKIARGMSGEVDLETVNEGKAADTFTMFTTRFPAVAKAAKATEAGRPDAAMASAVNGGIDFDADNLNVQVQGDSRDFRFDFKEGMPAPEDITGAKFLIRSITPVTNLPMILGLSTGPGSPAQPSASNTTLAKR